MSETGTPVVEVHTQPEVPAEVAEVAIATASSQAVAAVANAEATIAIAEVQEAAATERAEIHAAADVAIAEAHAEAATEVAAAVTREELEECRKNFETLSTQHQQMLSTLQTLEQKLAPPNPPETLENSAGEKTDNPGESDQSPPEPSPPKKSKVRWT